MTELHKDIKAFIEAQVSDLPVDNKLLVVTLGRPGLAPELHDMAKARSMIQAELIRLGVLDKVALVVVPPHMKVQMFDPRGGEIRFQIKRTFWQRVKDLVIPQ